MILFFIRHYLDYKMQKETPRFAMSDLFKDEKIHNIKISNYSFLDPKNKQCKNPNCTLSHSAKEIDINMGAKKYIDIINSKIKKDSPPPWLNISNLSEKEEMHYIGICSYSFLDPKNGQCNNPNCTFVHSAKEIDIRMSSKKYMDVIKWKIKNNRLPSWLNIDGLTPEEIYVYIKVCMNITRHGGCAKKNCPLIHYKDPIYIEMSRKKLTDYYKYRYKSQEYEIKVNTSIIDNCDCKSDIESETE